jgi:hypothetical protein
MPHSNNEYQRITQRKRSTEDKRTAQGKDETNLARGKECGHTQPKTAHIKRHTAQGKDDQNTPLLIKTSTNKHQKKNDSQGDLTI